MAFFNNRRFNTQDGDGIQENKIADPSNLSLINNVDSGKKFDDNGNTVNDVLSASKVIELISNASSGKVFKGTWDADNNLPTLPILPIGKQGDYYDVIVAGSQFGIDFSVGDIIIIGFNDATQELFWIKEDFNQNATQISYDNTISNLTAINIQDAVDEISLNKQNKTDNALTTTEKKIVPAINELKEEIDIVNQILTEGTQVTTYIKSFTATDWVEEVDNQRYTLLIPATEHEQGEFPSFITVYKKSGTSYNLIIVAIEILENGDVLLQLPQLPDITFNGKISISLSSPTPPYSQTFNATTDWVLENAELYNPLNTGQIYTITITREIHNKGFFPSLITTYENISNLIYTNIIVDVVIKNNGNVVIIVPTDQRFEGKILINK